MFAAVEGAIAHPDVESVTEYWLSGASFRFYPLLSEDRPSERACVGGPYRGIPRKTRVLADAASPGGDARSLFLFSDLKRFLFALSCGGARGGDWSGGWRVKGHSADLREKKR